LSPLAGGASSMTFAAEFVHGGARTAAVVKVAPPGLEPIRNRDVLRQARILRVLAGEHAVPVPAVLFEDRGDPPDVPPLFAMTRVAGDSVEPGFDRSPAPLDAGSERATVEAIVGERAHRGRDRLGDLVDRRPALRPGLVPAEHGNGRVRLADATGRGAAPG